MRPDADLATLLGVTTARRRPSPTATSRSHTATPPGQGITGETIQFHGTADRYTSSGATRRRDAVRATRRPRRRTRPSRCAASVATVVRPPRSPTTCPLDRVHPAGQPAWSGQERDGTPPIRSDDLFFGAHPGPATRLGRPRPRCRSRRPTSSSACSPTSSLQMNADRAPLPRFWYLPRGEKAAVVMTGDDHGGGGTAGRFAAEVGAEPARLLGRGLGVRAQHLVRVPGRDRSPPTRSHDLRGAGLRSRVAREHRLHGLDARPARATSTRTSSPAGRRSSRRRPRRRPTGRTASSGATTTRSPRSSSRTASGSTRTTTTGPVRGCTTGPASSPVRDSRNGSRPPAVTSIDVYQARRR